MPAGFIRLLMMVALVAGLLGPAPVVRAQTAVSEAAHQQFVFAYRLLQRGDQKLAVDAFDDYLGRFPRDEKRGDGLYFRALLAKQAGQTLEAQKYLDQPAPAPTLVPLSALLLLKGEVAADLQQYDKALQSLEKIDFASLEPSLQASAYYLRGQAYRGTGKLDAAAAQFEAAAKIDTPLRPRATLDLARTLAQAGKLEPAIAAARAAATSGDPAVSPEAARAAGDYAYQAGQYAQAVDFYRIVMTNYTTSPQMSPAAVGMMWAMLEMKTFPQIIAAFEQYKSVMTPEDRVVAWYLTGSAYQEAGEHDKAAGLFNALVLGSTGSAVEDKAMYKLAYSQAELGQYEQAIQTVNRLKEKHPNSPLVVDAQFLLASVDTRRGDPAAGIDRVSELVKQGSDKPYHAKALFLRGKLHENAGKLDAAAADYQAFLQAATPATAAASQIQEASLRLIDIEYRQNRFASAAKVATQLLAMPNLPATMRQETLYRQALVLIRLNEIALADAALTALVTEAPKSPLAAEGYYYRGLARMALKKPDEAIADLTVAAGSDKLAQDLKINALRLISIRQRETRKTEEIVKTIQSLEKLAGIAGLSAGELLWIGHYELERNQPAAALRYLQVIVNRQVDAATDQRAWALRMKGRALKQTNDLSGAIGALREAVALTHRDPGRTRLELAAALAQAGQITEAMDEYHGLVNSEQSAVAAAALDQLAGLHLKAGEDSARTNDAAGAKQSYEEARKLLKRLVLLYNFPELSPLPQQAYVRLAEVEMALGNPQTARAELQELETRYPNTPYAQYAKARALVIQNQKLGDAAFLLGKLREQKLDPVLQARVDDLAQQLEKK